jgi:predicted regulator of Ras-like GTPase activity (Roadblock/LC7/MglB family)
MNSFVRDTAGVTDSVAVSSDGLLMARSNTLDDAGADQIAAIISGFVSLGQGATRCFDFEALQQVIIAMKGGYLFVTAMGTAGCLGVVATPQGDIGNIGYQMALLVERAGAMLTPELVDELKNLVSVR